MNTAGWVHHGTVTETDDENWHRSFRINLDSIFCYPRRTAGHDQEWRWFNCESGFDHLASIASSIKGFKFRAGYSASKAAVIGLTKSVAVDYMDDNIRCHAICPGTTETPSLHDRMNALADELGGFDKARQLFIDRQPMKRLG